MAEGLADSDWGLCVGIASYVPDAHLVALPGARVDAQRFHDWLVSPGGGGVKPEQCKLLLSPEPQLDDSPQPLANDIAGWLTNLFELARANEKARRGPRVGRRLYLYFSGHGLSLGDSREAVLLTANAEPPMSCDHFAGRLWADWFRLRCVFDQVMLVMDCCRLGERTVHVNGPPWQTLAAKRPARQFYAFAAGDGATAREVVIDGKPAGLFTHKLLEYLEDPAQRPLSASRLCSLLYRALSGPNEPVIEISRNPDDDFEVAPAPPPPGKDVALRGDDEPLELLAVFDDDPGAQAPRVTPAIQLAGGATRGITEVRMTNNPPRALVIESERAATADFAYVLDALRPTRAVLYASARPTIDSDRLQHVLARETDSPVLARVRVKAALDRVATASLEVRASDPWTRVRVWNASGELLAEGFESVLLDGVPQATYRVRASIGSTSWTADHALDRDHRLDIPALALDTAAPVEGSSRWTPDDRAGLAAVDRSLTVTVAHRGLASSPRARDEVIAATVSAGAWTVDGFRTTAPRLVLEVPVSGRSIALSLPARPGQRTEVYVDGAGSSRAPDVAIRVVAASLSVGAPCASDRAREALRLASSHGGPQRVVPFAGMASDPIAALLAAAASDDPIASIDAAAAVLGETDEDVTAWRGRGGIAAPPLLASSWARIVASGADVAKGSLADQLAGRQLVLAPWLAWRADLASGGTDWLRSVAGAMWPAWDSDPAGAQAMVELAAAGGQLGVPSGCARRETYKSPPLERLVRHEAVAFVGASNDQLAASLAIAFVERAKRRWQSLTLWFLGDARLARLQSSGRSGASLRRARDRAEAELVRLLPVIASHWRVLRYDGFDVRGTWHFGSFWDWQQPGGFVHISPYRPGNDVRTASKLDMERPAASPPDSPYDVAVQAYEQLRPTAIIAESGDAT